MSARIRAGSMFSRFLCFVLSDVRGFRVSPGVRIPQFEDHCTRPFGEMETEIRHINEDPLLCQWDTQTSGKRS
jgi:hypothetical protein